MKLLLLKTLLQRRARDEGFTLPMVIALGLVMILLGAVNITSASEENLNAITQNSRSDALAIAEIGVTRYREFLDRNRTLALYDSAQWTGRTNVCDGDIANFFPGAANINSIALAENGIDLNNDGDSTDTFAPGSYYLVSYDYTNTNGTFDQTDDAANNNARGILTVRGVTPDNNEAQIQVEIPILINQLDMNNLAPALWIGDNTVTAGDLGSLTIDDGNVSTINDGNVVIKDQAITTSGSEADGCRDFSDADNSDGSANLATADRPVISDSRDIPSIQPIINTISAAGTQVNNAIPGRVVGDVNANAYVDPPTGETFDENTHCADIRQCRYYYNLTTAQTFDNDIRTDGIAQATLYVNSTLTINPAGSSIDIGSGVASNYFEIYVDNGQKITIDTSGGATVNIDAFIHAPESQLEITGNGTVNINGSVWVNDFVSSANATVNIAPDKSNISSSVSDMAYEFYTTTPNRTAKPLTGTPTNWKTEAIN